jgi:hypothetical protein
MSANGKQDQLRLGFLTAVEVPDRGFVGGLLVTTQCGRPLEFQCTAPVRPSATQRILYGPTLEPFLLGELIGGTLIDKAGVKPQLILTDREQILELRIHVELPVVFVCSSAETAESTDIDGRQCLRLGCRIVRFHPAHQADHAAISRDAARIPSAADLQEPFERVREALQETLRCGALK